MKGAKINHALVGVTITTTLRRQGRDPELKPLTFKSIIQCFKLFRKLIYAFQGTFEVLLKNLSC
jgi:hypothetical protein